VERLETAVALTIFNNPEATQRVFDRIAAARPERLFLIADAPRPTHPGEADLVDYAKRIATSVDWSCQVETNFATENMGPRRRIISGLDWVFSRVEAAIVLEHDCLPHESFFPFCFEVLERYRNHHQIGYITGFNPLADRFPFEYSYYFSRVAHLWGWATWRRSWQQYDEHLSQWPEVKKAGLLHLLFPSRGVVDYWSNVFDNMHSKNWLTTWDYQMVYTAWTRNWVNIVSGKNLIKYIGFVPSALHTKTADPGLDLDSCQIDFPLSHPPAITTWPAQEMGVQNRFYARNIFRRLCRRLTMEYRLRYGRNAG
jgi:hypothetical protein